MKNQNFIPELKLLKRTEKPESYYCKDKFIEKYDQFIDRTDSEVAERYFRELASYFYIQGFHDGESAMQIEK